MIKGAGFMGANCAGSYRVALVHPRDIAAAAAEELTRPAAPVGRTIRYVASDERTQDEVAQALGAAIGRSDLRWVAFTDEQMRDNLLKNGLPASVAADIVDIYASMTNGTLAEDYEQHKPALELRPWPSRGIRPGGARRCQTRRAPPGRPAQCVRAAGAWPRYRSGGRPHSGAGARQNYRFQLPSD
nr:hypothetical protein [Tanacetum cinerariifolium]